MCRAGVKRILAGNARDQEENIPRGVGGRGRVLWRLKGQGSFSMNTSWGLRPERQGMQHMESDGRGSQVGKHQT